MQSKRKPSLLDDWRRAIVHYIANHPDQPLKPKPLARELGISSSQYAAFRALIHDLLDDATLVLGPGRALKLPKADDAIVGTFRAARQGYGFVVTPGRPDLFVPEAHTGDALDGDTVTVRLMPGRGRGEPRAAVVRVVERALLHWVGVLEHVGHGWFVRPQGKARLPLIQIEDPTAKSAKPGDLVVVEPIESTVSSRSARGVIVERLGPASRSQSKILAVIRRHGIPDRFPPAVRRAAQRAAQRLDVDACPDREDLRDLTTITIDPADARDFDDAISIERLPGDRMRLGVHIADVAHFVQPAGVIDREARLRGTSAYFPGFVVPMLPETLSNSVCSLQPKVPRFAKSVFMTYDAHARVSGVRLCNSVIRSDARLTYEEASAILDGARPRLPKDAVRLLLDANKLARRIQKRRHANGMIVLSLPEVEIRLDKDGCVEDSGPADTSFSHTIIEMFMIEANEAVCRAFVREDLPHLRRVHPEPGPKAELALAQIAHLIGRKMPVTLDRATIRELLASVRGRPEELAVNHAVLRSFSQAVYSPSLEGHFALASKHYCHFTSPIRRYPDLVVHRLFDQVVAAKSPGGGRAADVDIEADEDLATLGRETSVLERRAQQAEWDAKAMLLLELMKDKLGESFDGIITGITSFGAFILTFPHLAEGLVHVRDFGPDNWVFEKKRMMFQGSHSGRIVSVGQRVRVLVAAVDEFRSEMSLVPPPGAVFGVLRAKRERKAQPTRRKAGRKAGRQKRHLGR